jgi:hypothetical protein
MNRVTMRYQTAGFAARFFMRCTVRLAPRLRKTFRDWPRMAARDRYTGLETHGQVAERLKAPVSKTGIPFGVSWVRIPPCPLRSTSPIKVDPVQEGIMAAAAANPPLQREVAHRRQRLPSPASVG